MEDTDIRVVPRAPTAEPAVSTGENPHTCHCKVVAACPIMVHPDKGVQTALAALSEEVARYDESTGAVSRVELMAVRMDGGTFTSITVNTGWGEDLPRDAEQTAGHIMRQLPLQRLTPEQLEESTAWVARQVAALYRGSSGCP